MDQTSHKKYVSYGLQCFENAYLDTYATLKKILKPTVTYKIQFVYLNSQSLGLFLSGEFETDLMSPSICPY